MHHRLGAFFHVAAHTGARRGELLNLRWTGIDLDARRITITGSTAVIAGERIDGTTKSGRARVVSIDDGTVAVLRQHQADQAADQQRQATPGAASKLEGASDVGAAYRNRTDDLRITSASL